MITQPRNRRGLPLARRWAALVFLGCAPELACGSPVGSAETSSTTSSGSSTTSTGCELPEIPADEERAIRLRNGSDRPIWITGVHSLFPFGIEGPDGDVTDQIYPRCDSCSTVLEQGCEEWCEDHGDQVAIRVEAGGTFEKIWSGRLWETITLACEGCDAACDVASMAASGDYLARVSVFSSCTANARPSLPGCDCKPDAGGACEIFRPDATFADEVEIEAGFVWPGAEAVELLVE